MFSIHKIYVTLFVLLLLPTLALISTACRTAEYVNEAPQSETESSANERPPLSRADAKILANRPLEPRDCRTTECLNGAQCVHRDEINCASSELCEIYGQCSFFPKDAKQQFGDYLCTNWTHEACGAQTDDQCLQSLNCKRYGECKAGDSISRSRLNDNCTGDDYSCYIIKTNVCLKTDSGCLKSEDCFHDGRCALDQSGNECRPKNKAHCEQSSECFYKGKCDILFESGNLCAPTTDAHCKQSDECKTENKCTLHQNRCVSSTSSRLTP